ncbi:MAG: 3',5'-cyclic nucleotide phosphodiesterase [Prevotellaceae bacterium]|jgi:hypothetical protein|nr:3',5'-cyclic nucleotide phosphodiesterase [Prevotellaceae bacterium]
MWSEQKIEQKLLTSLKTEFGEDKAKEYYADYVSARTYIIDNILPEIKAKQPDISYHDASHIQNVLQNAYFLLEDDGLCKLTGLEIYCLCLIAVFHDVGNIEGRELHHDKAKIAEVYNKVRNGDTKYNQERHLIITGASAHSGITKSGSTDTLKDIDRMPTNLDGHPIKLRDIACIIRFADELAEGYQRTSDYKNKKDEYIVDSKIFHQYAEQVNVQIDRGGNRIVLTYHIELNDKKSKSIDWKILKTFLGFIYKRIIKLNEERLYAKYYSELLSPFKRTEVIFKFYANKIPCDIDIDKVVLDNEYVVPRKEKDIEIQELTEKFSSLDINSMINLLKKNSEL